MESDLRQKNKQAGLKVLAIVAAMFILAYASFPLYSLFCKVTGYGGTPKVAKAASENISDKTVVVRFNADIDPHMPWKFQPEQKQLEVRLGENKMAFFSAENIADKAITGVATYNIVPERAASYFNKIQCFCFDQQTLEKGEKVDMPVSFFVDPEILNDPDLKGLDTITLSYTFFEADK